MEGELENCDLVMQGGVTSGLVYPAAVLALHDRYRFRSVGGTSAGAIAAAVTAAAEAGRGLDGGAAGFSGLCRLTEELGSPGFVEALFGATPPWRSWAVFRKDLFRKAPASRPLLTVLLAVLRGLHGTGRTPAPLRVAGHVTLALAMEIPLALLLGAISLASLASCLVLPPGGDLAASDLVVLTAALVAGAALGGASHLLLIALTHVPANGFGVTTGHDGDDGEQRMLTPWLHASINELAGRDPDGPPLTFGDLTRCRCQPPCPSSLEARPGATTRCATAVTLRMLTTNISSSRPHVLPFESEAGDARARRRYLFRSADLEPYFPRTVIDHMKRHAHVPSGADLPDGVYFLPDPDDLPVVFATRLSLSFPILISAVPLLTFRPGVFAGRSEGTRIVIEDGDLVTNWFSDGGICSNFPIHFFDRWIPGWPTLALRFTGARDGEPAEPRVLGRDPHSVAPVAPVVGLAGFVAAIARTAMDWRDTLQCELPGFRERTVEIPLTADVGGLNLDMGKRQVEHLSAIGAQAGACITRDFVFEEHRLVRLRALLARLTDQSERTRDLLASGWSVRACAEATDSASRERSADWVPLADAFLARFGAASKAMPFKAAAALEPRPRANLRLVPRE